VDRGISVSISLDHSLAKRILFEEIDLARTGQTCELVASWQERVLKLGELCPPRKSSTVIAALGTALLAKSTDGRVDVYSLLDRGEAENSYSARSLADNVWARHRAELGVDLGANGANPLNNTPFIGKTRIDEISGVRNREGWAYFLGCMETADWLESSDSARLALRGFLLARSKSMLAPINVEKEAGDSLSQSALIQALDRLVAEDSEGGRRAQACASAILDAVYGEDRVNAGKINDPDRRTPLDVAVNDTIGDGFEMAVEVKDKPIDRSSIISSIEKTVRDHGRINMVFLAVSSRQKEKDFDSQGEWAKKFGVKFTVHFSWETFFIACKSFAPVSDSVFEGVVFRRLLQRGQDLDVNRDALQSLLS